MVAPDQSVPGWLLASRPSAAALHRTLSGAFVKRLKRLKVCGFTTYVSGDMSLMSRDIGHT